MKESRILIYTNDVFPQEKQKEVERKYKRERNNKYGPFGHSLHFSEEESALAAHYLKYSLGHPKAILQVLQPWSRPISQVY